MHSSSAGSYPCGLAQHQGHFTPKCAKLCQEGHRWSCVCPNPLLSKLQRCCLTAGTASSHFLCSNKPDLFQSKRTWWSFSSTVQSEDAWGILFAVSPVHPLAIRSRYDLCALPQLPSSDPCLWSSPLVPLPRLPLFSSPRQPSGQLRYWHKLNKLSQNS